MKYLCKFLLLFFFVSFKLNTISNLKIFKYHVILKIKKDSINIQSAILKID